MSFIAGWASWNLSDRWNFIIFLRLSLIWNLTTWGWTYFLKLILLITSSTLHLLIGVIYNIVIINVQPDYICVKIAKVSIIFSKNGPGTLIQLFNTTFSDNKPYV